jgi:chromosome segregation and condensation protein ScpB
MKQSVLIKIRGNKGYDHVKKFVEMNLIVKKKMGHTSELTLSDNFHEYFHVEGQASLNPGEEQKMIISPVEKQEEKQEEKRQ